MWVIEIGISGIPTPVESETRERVEALGRAAPAGGARATTPLGAR